MQNVDVSIVIPTYNRSNLLLKTLNSLFEQTYPVDKYEIIVCDDNSKDDTEKVVQKLISETEHNLKYLKIKSDIKGPAKVRNAGILNSSGSIVGFTDDDCTVPKNWIEEAVRCFTEHTEICGVTGAVITEGNCKDEKFRIPHIINVLGEEKSYVTSNIFYKKQVLLDVGCFDVEMRHLEDIELGWRVEAVGKIMFKPELLVHHKLFCITLLNYLKRQRFHVEYWVLMHSKHPEHRKKDNLILDRINHKRTFYTISIITCLLFYLFDKNIFNFLIIITVLAYLWAYVVIDTQLIKYPIRILKFPLHLMLDLFRFIYSVKGSIKAKFIMFY